MYILIIYIGTKEELDHLQKLFVQDQWRPPFLTHITDTSQHAIAKSPSARSDFTVKTAKKQNKKRKNEKENDDPTHSKRKKTQGIY